jgi:hypothetical protein
MFTVITATTKIANPEMYSMYKLAILLYESLNNQMPSDEWVQLNFQQITDKPVLCATKIKIKHRSKRFS